MTETTKDRIKRWAKVWGHFLLVAIIGGNEYPLGQYDPKPKQENDDEEG